MGKDHVEAGRVARYPLVVTGMVGEVGVAEQVVVEQLDERGQAEQEVEPEELLVEDSEELLAGERAAEQVELV